MRNLLAEALLVFSYSTKTQIAWFLGIVGFAGLLVAGVVLANGVVLNGLLERATPAIRESIIHIFEIAAWINLVGFMSVAVRCYIRDRRRLFDI